MDLPDSYRELQAACKRLGLRAVGKKSELRHRLETHYSSMRQGPSAKESAGASTGADGSASTPRAGAAGSI